MTYMRLRANDVVRGQMLRFRTILAGYTINVLDYWENEIESTIEFTTDAEREADINSVKAVAYDCFAGDILGFKHSGKFYILRPVI